MIYRWDSQYWEGLPLWAREQLFMNPELLFYEAFCWDELSFEPSDWARDD